MAVEQLMKQGPQVLFSKDGGTNPVNTPLLWTPAGLASGAGACTQHIDFARGDVNQLFSEIWGWRLRLKWSSAPTAGGIVRLYVAYSLDGTTWPAGLAGTDGDVAALTWLKRPYVERIGEFAVINSTTAHLADGWFKPRMRYGQFIVWNGSSEAIEPEPGAAVHSLTIWPHRGFMA